MPNEKPFVDVEAETREEIARLNRRELEMRVDATLDNRLHDALNAMVGEQDDVDDVNPEECSTCGVEGGHAHFCPDGAYGDYIDRAIDEGIGK